MIYYLFLIVAHWFHFVITTWAQGSLGHSLLKDFMDCLDLTFAHATLSKKIDSLEAVLKVSQEEQQLVKCSLLKVFLGCLKKDHSTVAGSVTIRHTRQLCQYVSLNFIRRH